jgi:hypothetical protein
MTLTWEPREHRTLGNPGPAMAAHTAGGGSSIEDDESARSVASLGDVSATRAAMVRPRVIITTVPADPGVQCCWCDCPIAEHQTPFCSYRVAHCADTKKPRHKAGGSRLPSCLLLAVGIGHCHRRVFIFTEQPELFIQGNAHQPGAIANPQLAPCCFGPQ